MSSERVSFEAIEHVSGFIPTEELSVVADDDLITEYEKRQYQPVSIYDQHQESLFIEGIQRFTDRLANTEALQQWCKQPKVYPGQFTRTETIALPGKEPYTIVSTPRQSADYYDDLIDGKAIEPGTDPRLLKVVRAVKNMDKNRIWETVHGEVRSSSHYDFSDRLDDYVQYQKLQLSHLFTEKVIFEMERNRPDVATWLVKNITSYGDKLRLFDEALKSGSPTSDNVLTELGDLRGEAEQAGDMAGLTRYLMVELEHGMNPFENSRAVLTLLEDGNNTIGNNSDKKYEVEYSLENILLAEAIQMADAGNDDDARELLALHPLALRYLDGRTQAMDRLKQNLDQPLPTKRRLLKPIKEALGTNQRILGGKQIGHSYRPDPHQIQACLNLIGLHLTYPSLDLGVDITDIYRELQRRDKTLGPRDKNYVYGNVSIKDQEIMEFQGTIEAHMVMLKKHYFAKNGFPVPTFGQPDANDMSEYEYAANINKGITDENIIPLFAKAASLTLHAHETINSDEKHIAKMYADLELVVQHIDAGHPVTAKDMVVQSRHRALYNSELTKLFEETSKIPYATQRVEFLYNLLTVQRQHDTTEDSTYEKQKRMLREAARQCIGNPVAQLGLDEDTIRRMCAEFDIDLG